jgi:uncharacterized protein
MHDVTALDLSRIAQDLQIRKTQVESVVQLLDEGNTIPFITRYRKERTGGLNEDVLRQIQTRLTFQRQLADRKQTILKSIDGQGKLTEALRAAVLAADTNKRLEDLYLPYKPKKRSLATAAREKGLEPLAVAIWNRDPAASNLAELVPTLVNPEKELKTPEDVLAGVQHILAEMMAETADVRASTRSLLWEAGKICAAKSDKLAEGQGLDFKDYFEFSESLRQIPPHRILALNRGEKENALKVRLDFNGDHIKQSALRALAEHLLKISPAPEEGEALTPDSAYQSPHAVFLRLVLDDALARLVLPSLEREIRRELTEEAESHAVMVFARNLRSLLLQPPLQGRRVLAIDPGFRTGCKVVALDEHGTYLEEGVIYPHALRDRERKAPKEKEATPPPVVPPPDAAAAAPPAPAEAVAPAPEAPSPAPAPAVSPETVVPTAVDAAPPVVTAVSAAPAPVPTPVVAPPSSIKREDAKTKVCDLVTRHRVHVIAIGNGTACRETEEFVSELIKDRLPDLAYVIVNEAGASVYSASAIGREEFPDHDATVRGTISIGRRLQDPLSELVKVDPQNIGVGLYQHDISPRHLKESLEGIIESCVNQVGVDLNSASVPLLRHVSGLNQMVARDVVEYRKQNGVFKSREQLLQVPNIGPTRYVQAAGFLKIPSGENPLDRTWIHPESYGVAASLLSELGFGPEALDDKSRADELRQKLRSVHVEETAARLTVGAPTLRDILEALARPGRDPREDLPPPVFKKGILRIEDLQPGMELKGTVLNVVDFGAFVDIGLKDSGLVHISQMANRYIKSPYDVVAVNDVVTVWVLNVDQDRHRVSLTMIQPGSERLRQERRPPAQRPPQQSPRPPQAPRPPRTEPAGQGQGPAPHGPQGDRRGPPRGRGTGPGRGPQPRRESPAPTGAGSEMPSGGPPGRSAESARAMPPPPPPRKPRREPPRAKLTKEAIEGKVPLRTFGELSALFAVKRDEPAPAVEAPPASQDKPATEPPLATTTDHAPAVAPTITEQAAQPQPAESTSHAEPVPPPEAHAHDAETGA